jgi:hypothetical protein
MGLLIAAVIVLGLVALGGSKGSAANPLPPPPAPGPVPPPSPLIVPAIFPTPSQPGVIPVSPASPPAPITDPTATLTVTTASTGQAGDLHVRSTPDDSSDANILGTVPHGATVRPDAAIGWPDGSGNLTANDPSGNFNPATGWYHITDVNNQGSPPGVAGFASAQFLSVA